MATSPVESFSRNISSSGSGFDAKLQALVGIGQAVKQSQVAKQRMQDQFQQQKDLIQFRSDTQLNKQLEYYDRVTRPQQEAQVKAEAQSQQIEITEDSRKSAESKASSIMEDFYDTYGNVADYNLYQPVTRAQYDPETGLYESKIFTKKDGKYVETNEQVYLAEVNALQNEVEWFERIQEGLDNGWFPEDLPENRRTDADGAKRLTRSEASQIIKEAHINPELARAHLSNRPMYATPSPMPDEPLSEGTGSGGARNQSGKIDVYNSMTNMRGVMDLDDEGRQTGEVTFSAPEEQGWFDWFSEPSVVNDKVSLQGVQSVPKVMEQLQQVSENLYGVDISKVRNIPDSSVRQQVLSGDTTGLSGDVYDMAEKISKIKEDDFTDKQFNKLQTLYLNIPDAFQEWNAEYAPHSEAGDRLDQYYINFTSFDSPKNMFVKKGEDVMRNLQLSNKYKTQQ